MCKWQCVQVHCWIRPYAVAEGGSFQHGVVGLQQQGSDTIAAHSHSLPLPDVRPRAKLVTVIAHNRVIFDRTLRAPATIRMPECT
jgi:hypothetical protein